MSEIKYQFSKMPIEWLTSSKISATEKVVLGVLIALGNETGVSCVGYMQLAQYCCVKSRSYMIDLINNLEKKGYVERFPETGRNHASKLRVRFERLGGTFGLCDKESVRTDYLSQKESAAENKRVLSSEQKSPLQRTQTIFKLDLNYNKEKSPFEQTIYQKKEIDRKESESADVAADLSKPCGEQVAAKDLAKSECDEAEAAKLQTLLPVLNDYFGDLMPWIQIFEVNHKIGIRVLGGRISGVDLDVVKGFAARHNIIFSQQQYANERIIAA